MEQAVDVGADDAANNEQRTSFFTLSFLENGSFGADVEGGIVACFCGRVVVYKPPVMVVNRLSIVGSVTSSPSLTPP